MPIKFNMLTAAAVVAGSLTLISAKNSYAASHFPIIGKGSIVSKRVFLGRTYSRSNAHAIRIAAIRARLHK